MKNQRESTTCADLNIESNECETSSPEFTVTLPLSDNKEIKISVQGTINSEAEELIKNIINFLSDKKIDIDEIQPYSKAEKAATEIINRFGIPAHTRGYRYLRDAVVLVSKSPELMGSVTGKLYPYIAQQHDTTPVRVERVIRHAIESCFNKDNCETVYRYFPHCLSNKRDRPTNSEFIAVISDKLRMQTI